MSTLWHERLMTKLFSSGKTERNISLKSYSTENLGAVSPFKIYSVDRCYGVPSPCQAQALNPCRVSMVSRQMNL